MSVQTKAVKAVKAAKSKTPASKSPTKKTGKRPVKPTEPQATKASVTTDAPVARVHMYSDAELKALPQAHCLRLIAKRWRRQIRRECKQAKKALPANLFSLSTAHARKTLGLDPK